MRGRNPEEFIVRNLLIGLALLTSVSVYAVSDRERAAIEERIKPVGEVCMQGDASCGSASASAGGDGPGTPAEIYAASCKACHSIGLAGAPKPGDDDAWEARTDKGLDAVYANAINGIGGMPPKGTCMSCSDDDIVATVDYMIEGD